MRVLITGRTGQVGLELSRQAWPDGIELVSPDRERLDLGDPEAIRTYVANGDFSAAINPAAYTAVDQAETNVIEAFKINALAPAALAQATRDAGIPLIHVSTDYVFDGSKVGPYLESDPVRPLGVYGASKEAGEQAVRSGNHRHIILRTAWVFSPHRSNFVKTMLRLSDRPVLKVVDDQQGSPTAASDLALALMTITLRLLADPGAGSGTYHFVNDGAATWKEFAEEIFRQAAAQGRTIPRVEAIRTAHYPTPARRPSNSVLSVAKLRQDFQIEPRNWKEALGETMANLELTRVKERR